MKEAMTRRLMIDEAIKAKTFIAFQICHKLTKAKWQKDNLGVERPKILFITDRNILADQAYDDFHFSDGDCFRYEAGTELKLTRYLYFTLFQTLIGEMAVGRFPRRVAEDAGRAGIHA